MSKKVAMFVIIIAILMFALFTSFFKSDTNSATVEQTDMLTNSIHRLELPLEKYSFDFSGADKIVVQYDDLTLGDKRPLEQKEITDPKAIALVVEKLSKLPKEGDMMKKLSPGQVTGLYAFKGEEAFAFVTFYRTALKAEDTAFYSSGDKLVGQLESELYSMVAELR